MRAAQTRISSPMARDASSRKQDHTKEKSNKARLMGMGYISLLMERRNARERGNAVS